MTIHPFKLFYCYAHEDKEFHDALEVHLSTLKRLELITTWHAYDITAGDLWEKAIDTHLDDAHIILLLVSAYFIASDYCYSKEMTRALERHYGGTARVIPIIIRAVDWEGVPFQALQMLPTNAKPVSLWQDRDEALSHVVLGIRKAVKELLASSNINDQVNNAQPLEQRERYEEKLEVVEAEIHSREQIIDLIVQERYEEVLEATNQALHFDATDSFMFRQKSITLNALERYEEALEVANQTIQLDATDSFMFRQKSIALNALECYKEALEAVDQAIRLDSADSSSFALRSFTLNQMGYYSEAWKAANHAIQLNHTDSFAFEQKNYALKSLEPYLRDA